MKHMHIKHFVLPLALIVPILLALLLISPSQTAVQLQQNTEVDIAQYSAHQNIATPSVVNSAPQHKVESVEDFDDAIALTMLSEIALDDKGAPIVNTQLKQQLDNAVRLIGRERSPAELAKLSELIAQAFKPQTAQAINHILFQYHAYKIAEQDYTNAFSVSSPEDISRNTKMLSTLRESYLGNELAEKLFGEENVYHNYMSELTERLSSNDLSEDRRNSISKEVRKKYYPDQEVEDL